MAELQTPFSSVTVEALGGIRHWAMDEGSGFLVVARASSRLHSSNAAEEMQYNDEAGNLLQEPRSKRAPSNGPINGSLESVPFQATLRGGVLPRPLDLGTVLLARIMISRNFSRSEESYSTISYKLGCNNASKHARRERAQVIAGGQPATFDTNRYSLMARESYQAEHLNSGPWKVADYEYMVFICLLVDFIWKSPAFAHQLASNQYFHQQCTLSVVAGSEWERYVNRQRSLALNLSCSYRNECSVRSDSPVALIARVGGRLDPYKLDTVVIIRTTPIIPVPSPGPPSPSV